LKEKIKVVIVDDNLDWLKLMTNYLNKESDILIVGTASGKEEAIDLAKTIAMDVVLMDIHLSENKYDGIDAVKKILEIRETKIIMMTALNEDELVMQSFSAGAVNFFSKNDLKIIPDAIRATYKKSSPIEILLNEYFHLKKQERLNKLTPAEKEIFSLMEEECSIREMEHKLKKSEGTIKVQVNRILKKLNAKTRKDAVRKVNMLQ